MSERTKSGGLYYAAVLAPAAAALVYILAFGVNVPFFDEWAFVDYLKAFNEGGGWLGMIFAQNAEHRHFFPNLIMLLLAKSTGWNIKAGMAAGWVLSFIGFCVLWLMVRKSGIKRKLPIVLISCVYFSFGQWENMLWGWQVSVYLMLLMVLCTVYFLSRLGTSAAYVIPAAICGTVGSFSFANGLLVWPLGFAQIALSDTAGFKKRTLLSVWLLAGIANFSVYFNGFVKVHHTVTGSEPVTVTRPEFFFANMGSLLGGRALSLSIWLGALLFIAFLALCWTLYKRGLLSRHLHWVVLGVFSIASSAAITMGRAGLNFKQAIVPRYTTITQLEIIAVIALGYIILADAGTAHLVAARRYAALAMLTVLCFGVISFDTYGLVWGFKTHRERAVGARALLTYETASDSDLRIITDDPAYVRARAGYLKENRLTIFRDGKV